MKTFTVRLPEALVAEIEAESRARKVSKSDIVRERLRAGKDTQQTLPAQIADLIGCVEGLPVDLSSAKRGHLEATGYGRKRSR